MKDNSRERLTPRATVGSKRLQFTKFIWALLHGVKCPTLAAKWAINHNKAAQYPPLTLSICLLRSFAREWAGSVLLSRVLLLLSKSHQCSNWILFFSEIFSSEMFVLSFLSFRCCLSSSCWNEMKGSGSSQDDSIVDSMTSLQRTLIVHPYMYQRTNEPATRQASSQWLSLREECSLVTPTVFRQIPIHSLILISTL